MSEPGFVHVHCDACNNPEVWLRCDQCSTSDHFQLVEGVVHCACGASYPSASCLCGASVPPDGTLEAVPFAQGPLALADLEIAWGRVVGLVVISGGVVGLVLWWWLA